jgi:sigma-B regulation protein RsbU (phosphoserine phosphatase)
MLCELTAQARFATLFWGIFDAENRVLHYVNAGHAPPMLVRRDRNFIERLDQGGPVLGLLPSAHYSAGSVRIERDDTLILYSDGVNEAANEYEEEFGEDRLGEMVSNAVERSPAELCDRIMGEVDSFASNGASPDDRTLMVIRFPAFRRALSRHGTESTGEAVAWFSGQAYR